MAIRVARGEKFEQALEVILGVELDLDAALLLAGTDADFRAEVLVEAAGGILPLPRSRVRRDRLGHRAGGARALQPGARTGALRGYAPQPLLAGPCP